VDINAKQPYKKWNNKVVIISAKWEEGLFAWKGYCHNIEHFQKEPNAIESKPQIIDNWKSYMNNGTVKVKDNNKQRKDTGILMSERDYKSEL